VRLRLVALVGLEEGFLAKEYRISHDSDELGGLVLVKEEDLVAGSGHRDVKSEGFTPNFVTGNARVWEGGGVRANNDDQPKLESLKFVDGSDNNFVGVEDAVA
jgi:hypothetical protein